ncbi:MAG: DEAD/DEAH box helicase family protein [Rhodospirillales bacterium]|nr:DEAD/DEAH box helicase family protein [Rhodospirillales bacterium]
MMIIDNINHRLATDLKQTIRAGARLKIAAATFSIYAYEALKKELEKIHSLEFIFTAPTFLPEQASDRFRKEHREFQIPKTERERTLCGGAFELQLKNRLTQRAIARECADWIGRKAKFRSNRGKAPMQQFASVTAGGETAVYLPLHGFTAVDLGIQKGDAVSNIVHKMTDAPVAATYLALFDQIWHDPERLEDVTAHICDHIASVYQENSPERIYFLILFNIFNEFLEDLSDDVLPNDLTGYKNTLIWQKLYPFQRDAATGIINKLETYNGCILADSVGLGKTFSALAVIKYYELRNRSVLVLCPKRLAQNWLNYNRNLKTNTFAKDRFNYDVLCHTDLLRDSGESFGTPLDRVNWGNYDLVVIDESHNFRNNEAFKERETRYQRLMNAVIKDGVKTKVLMLSATPVNNRFADLRNQLALAYEGDSDSLDQKLKTGRSVEEIFRRAQGAFNAWSKLAPEQRTPAAILNTLDFDFFELLDSVTIARSRRQIQTFYGTEEVGHFPTRLKPNSFHCPLTHEAGVISLNGIYEQLTLLRLSVYAPVSYIFPSRLPKYEERYDTEVRGGRLRQVDRERSLQALMTVNLLKRLESSVEAFRITLGRLIELHTGTLTRIESWKLTGKDGEFEQTLWQGDDSLDPDEMMIGGKIKISLADMDVPSWEHDLRGDLAIIEALLAEMAKITPEKDAKLQHLKAEIEKKLTSPINPSNRKLLIFSAFADTADYLYAQIAPDLLDRHGLHSAKVIGGTNAPKSTLGKFYDFPTVLTLFSPIAKEKAVVIPQEPRDIDILIGTDCISEGQNLQDCDTVVNYDIHWNPVSIIQRFGRIDRIGSRNAVIQLVNYWPDITLDEYINLRERVESRMVIADVTATGDDNVLSAEANDVSYRKEQLRRLQEEVIELEDVRTGISITDLGLNEFRMDLLNYVKANPDIAKAPNGMHAVVPAGPDLPPGAVFALRNRNRAVNVSQQNRLHPYYLAYIGEDGQVVASHMEAKKLLDLLRVSCHGRSEPVAEICRPFNEETQDGREMRRYSDLLTKAIGSMIELKEERDLDSLFSGGRTTALVDTIAGLDDFELVAFLVVREVS